MTSTTLQTTPAKMNDIKITTISLIPFILSFVSASYWLFFGPEAPATTVEETFLWAAPVGIPIIASSFFLTIRAFILSSHSYYYSSNAYESPEVAKFLVHSSKICCSTLILVIFRIVWTVLRYVVSSLDPYDPTCAQVESGCSSIGCWASVMGIMAYMVMVGIVFCWLVWMFAEGNVHNERRVFAGKKDLANQKTVFGDGALNINFSIGMGSSSEYSRFSCRLKSSRPLFRRF